MRWIPVLACGFLASSSFAQNHAGVPVRDLAQHAVEQSQLTLLQPQGFHLKADIAKKKAPDSVYRAKIEEYWVAPDKWRRTIESAEFSQTLVVNGTAISEKDTGDYYPYWLTELVTATFEPLPMLEQLRQSDSEIPKPGGDAKSCADFQMRIDRWTICFQGKDSLLESVFTKGYAVQFEEYKKFGPKQIARRLITSPEYGLDVEERITELSELRTPDEQMFEIKEPTPIDQQIRSVRVSDEVLRGMAIGSTDIAWPATGGGPAKGGCAVFVSTDRAGHIRETRPGGCDNAGLQNPLREQVMKWQLKPAIAGGAPVQVEALLGFSFETPVFESAGPPKLSNSEARALARHAIEPDFPSGVAPKGTEFIVQITVDDTGKVLGILNIQKLPGPILGAINKAVTQWHFKPYIRDGKPAAFNANISFRMR